MASRRGSAGASGCTCRPCSRRSGSPRWSTTRRTNACARPGRASDATRRLTATVRSVAQTPSTLAAAREEFLSLVDSVRPELHRYCARLTGSVIEGEDIVQETLAKGFYALSLSADVPPLRAGA